MSIIKLNFLDTEFRRDGFIFEQRPHKDGKVTFHITGTVERGLYEVVLTINPLEWEAAKSTDENERLVGKSVRSMFTNMYISGMTTDLERGQ